MITRWGASSVADITVRAAFCASPLAAAIRSEQHANARGLVEGGERLRSMKKISLKRRSRGF